MATNNFTPRKVRGDESFSHYHGSAKNLTEAHRRFAEEFCKSFDIDGACQKSNTVASIMACKLENPLSPVSRYINALNDRRRIANSYFNIDSLYSELLILFRDPKVRPADRLQAARLLSGIQVEPDDSREKFNQVLAALEHSNAEKVLQNAKTNSEIDTKNNSETETETCHV